MKTARRNANGIKTLCEYFIAIALILNTRSLYLHITNNSNNLFTFIVFLMLLIGVFGCLICEGRIPINKFNTGCTFVLFLAVYLLFYILIRHNDLIADIFYLISACVIFIYYYFCCSKNEIPNVIFKYRNVICFIAVFSMVMWLFCTKLNLVRPSGKLYSTWADNYVNNYYWIYFETQAQRNTAIFTEAPMSSLHFSVGLAIELFLSKRVSKCRSLVFILAILTTSSVTGYLFLGIAFGVKFLIYKPRNRIFNELKYIAVPIVFVTVVVIGYNLVMQRMATRSGIVRVNDFINCFNLWSENLLFGVGGGDIADELLSGSSNSLGRLLAERGIYIGIIYFYCFYKGIKNSITSKNINGFIFVILFLYLFILTIIPYTYLTMFLLVFFAKYSAMKPNNEMKFKENYKALKVINNKL